MSAPLFVRRGGHRTLSKTAATNLDHAFIENTFLHQSLIVKSQQNRIELVTRPGEYLLTLLPVGSNVCGPTGQPHTSCMQGSPGCRCCLPVTVGQSPGGKCRCPNTETGRPRPGSKTGGCRDVEVKPAGCAVDVISNRHMKCSRLFAIMRSTS